MRTGRATLILAFGAMPAGALSAISTKPPSSLEPPRTSPVLTVAYTHRVVRECAPRSWGPGRFCVEQDEAASAHIQLDLVPLRNANLERRKDERTPLRVVVSSNDSSGKSIELAPGLWELRWPGREQNERFTVTAGDAVDVMLRSTAGRCELAAGGICNLDPNTVRRRVALSFHRREPKG